MFGIDVSGANTAAEVMDRAGLNWTAEKWRLQAVSPAGETVDFDDRFGIVRVDNKVPLEVVGPDYSIMNNAESLEFMDQLVKEKILLYDKAVSLKGGKLISVLAKLPDDIELGRGDIIKKYVNMVNSFDGSKSYMMYPTSIRWVCYNTLMLSIQQGRQSQEGINIRHHSNLMIKIKEAKEKLEIVFTRYKKYTEEARALAAKSINKNDAIEYFKSLFKAPSDGAETKIRSVKIELAKTLDEVLQENDPRRNLLDKLDKEEKKSKAHSIYEKNLNRIVENFENPKNDNFGLGGTVWAALNAVTEFADHQSRTRGTNDQERKDNKTYSVLFGTANRLKQNAWDKALALV